MAKNRLSSFLPWRTTSQPNPSQRLPGSLHVDDLQQGNLYLLKMQSVKVALFEGWHDDMVIFSVLREESSPMRWSDSRVLAGQFQVFAAFDPDGNPPILAWDKTLKTPVPAHWFLIFEEARRFQRAWSPYSDHSSSRSPLIKLPDSTTLDRHLLKEMLQHDEVTSGRKSAQSSFRGNGKRNSSNMKRPPIPNRSSFYANERNEENPIATKEAQ
jgi:hypothetical protein